MKHIPPPCPVDDAPCHTCTAYPSEQGNNNPPQPPRNEPGAPTVPRVLGSLTAQARSVTVTTGTYTRGWLQARQKEQTK